MVQSKLLLYIPSYNDGLEGATQQMQHEDVTPPQSQKHYAEKAGQNGIKFVEKQRLNFQ